MTRLGRLVRGALWCGLLAGCAAVLGWAGAVAPLPTSPGALQRWLTGTEPELMAVALVRAVGLVLIGYLAAVTVIAVLVRLAGFDPKPAVRRLAGQRAARVLGAVLGAAVVTMPATSVARPAPTAPVPPPPATLTLVVGQPASPPGPATLSLDPTVDPTVDPSLRTQTPVPPVATVTDHGPVAATPPPAPATHVVQPGEHFWAIARAQVAARSGDPTPSDRAIWAYWRALIDANRDRLVVPDDPDLIYPGQELVLPPLSEDATPGRWRPAGR